MRDVAPRYDRPAMPRKGQTARQLEHEVELAKIQLEMKRLPHRYDLLRHLVTGLMYALSIVAAAVPLLVLRSVLAPFAGQETTVDVDVAVQVVLTASVVVNGLQYVKGRTRKQELRRERTRVERLEERLAGSAVRRAK